MLPPGHAGITLGLTQILNLAVKRSQLLRQGETENGLPVQSAEPIRSSLLTNDRSKADLRAILARPDARFVLLGSLLPDIIDKPVGQLFFRQTFSNGRIFSHTLIFLVLLSLAGLALYQTKRKQWGIVLAFGVFAHLLLDQMWLDPRTLLWPIYGFTFERADLTNWAQNILSSLLSDPAVYVPEIVGGVILLIFLVRLIRNKGVRRFLRYGEGAVI